MRKRRLCLLFLMVISLLIAGCGIPGVDYPIDEGAFWNPDVPDYADDGDVYSITMLSSGTVFDHTRYLNMGNVVANLSSQIQNQLLNLQKLGTHLDGLEERSTQLNSSNQQAQGIMNPSTNWNNVFHSTGELETGQYSPSTQDVEAILKENNQTYQDALRQAMMSTQTQYVQSMINQVNSQNTSILGNNQGKQNTNQGYATKVIQEAEINQSNAFIVSTVVTAAEMKQQANAEAFQNAKGIHVNVSDPYHPKPDEPEREQGKGFVNF